MSLIIDKITNKVATQNTVEALVDLIKTNAGGNNSNTEEETTGPKIIEVVNNATNEELYNLWVNNELGQYIYKNNEVFYTPLNWSNYQRFANMNAKNIWQYFSLCLIYYTASSDSVGYINFYVIKMLNEEYKVQVKKYQVTVDVLSA